MDLDRRLGHLRRRLADGSQRDTKKVRGLEMNRAQLKGKVQTVCGLIDPEKLGHTLMHEPLLSDLRTPDQRKVNEPEDPISLENVWEINYGRRAHRLQYVLDMKDIAQVEMNALRVLGGDSVVELTCGGIRPDPKGLADIQLGT